MYETPQVGLDRLYVFGSEGDHFLVGSAPILDLLCGGQGFEEAEPNIAGG